MSIRRETVEQRKALPLATGVLDYFPDALLAIAEVSRVGNEQHHPGMPLHWDKSKSTDEAEALMRHLLDRGTRDTDGLRHTAKAAWRALALLQRELDAEQESGTNSERHTFVVKSTEALTPEELQAWLNKFFGSHTNRSVTVGKREEWGTGDGPIYDGNRMY